MSDVRKIGRVRWAATLAALAFVGTGCPLLWFRALLERQSGLSPGAALEQAIVGGGWRFWLVLPIISAVAGLMAYLGGPPGARQQLAPEAARTAGSGQWRRMRLLATILALPFMLMTAGWVGYDLLAGKDLPEHVLMMVGLTVGYAVVAIVYWTVKPSPEYLYVLGTGDRSQVDDERARDVKGRAAVDAIGLLLALVLLVGVPYDVLIRGALPIRSGAEAGAIFLLWGLFSWHWNRKL